MKSVNPYTITLARELRQCSQAALCRELGIAQGTLSKIENEQIPASCEVIEKLAVALQLPESFFFQKIEYCTLPQTFFRKYKINQALTKSVRAKICILREQMRTLLKAIELPEDRVPRVDLDDYPGTIEHLAREVRLHWRIGPGPITNLTNLVEKAGVILLECDFGTAKVDAISMREEDLPPIIVVNKEGPGDRLRLNVAHELGHLIMHHGRFLSTKTGDIESEAYRFASAFLMPARDISGSFTGRVNLERLASLKRQWKVSMQALTMRACDLGKITEHQKRRLFMQMSKRGYRRHEPIYIEREEPTFVKALVKFHFDELGYGVRELSDALNVLEADMYEMYPRVLRKPLRLVE